MINRSDTSTYNQRKMVSNQKMCVQCIRSNIEKLGMGLGTKLHKRERERVCVSSDLEYSDSLSSSGGSTDSLHDPVNSLHGQEATSLQTRLVHQEVYAIPEMRGREGERDHVLDKL